ncbi:MAG TPA: hypothetical protein PKO41_01650 [Dokdonella sp.]|uniref:hypothetical protein n=1 Tax=Dokdonella sp. TaxID=2291710 RepID=UPI0025BDA8B6|nr:hypothetical protein [Dokdonella sp.]MBX3691153.1 hypothetical protein [Dokdonella sp.]MCW5566847.1 hypothetical protein [Dokdonella sp.]HNR91105.1 hypothetical protein [Dokdonella sp.]
MSVSFETLLERTKDEIRAEAEAIRRRLPVETVVQPSAYEAVPVEAGAARGPSQGPRVRLDYSIDELCLENYASFVERAFEAIIKRSIEPDTRSALVRRLASGTTKVEILGDLLYSPEGRSVGVRVAGLRKSYLLAKLFNVPVVGYLAEWCFRIARLPIQARQQRAMETYQAGRLHELRDAVQALELRCAELAREQDAIAARLAALTGDDEAGLKSLGEAQQEQAEQLEKLSRRVVELVDGQASGLREESRLRDAQVSQLAARIDEIGRHAVDGNEDYRRLVLGMNHWLTTLRTNLAELGSGQDTSPRRPD